MNTTPTHQPPAPLQQDTNNIKAGHQDFPSCTDRVRQTICICVFVYDMIGKQKFIHSFTIQVDQNIRSGF